MKIILKGDEEALRKCGIWSRIDDQKKYIEEEALTGEYAFRSTLGFKGFVHMTKTGTIVISAWNMSDEELKEFEEGD